MLLPHSKSSRLVADQSATYDFLLVFRSNYSRSHSRTVSEIKGDTIFAKFSHPLVCNAHADGVPLGIFFNSSGAR